MAQYDDDGIKAGVDPKAAFQGQAAPVGQPSSGPANKQGGYVGQPAPDAKAGQPAIAAGQTKQPTNNTQDGLTKTSSGPLPDNYMKGGALPKP